MDLVVIYRSDFGERVIGNLINSRISVKCVTAPKRSHGDTTYTTRNNRPSRNVMPLLDNSTQARSIIRLNRCA